jgi:hypothetical protein
MSQVEIFKRYQRASQNRFFWELKLRIIKNSLEKKSATKKIYSQLNKLYNLEYIIR